MPKQPYEKTPEEILNERDKEERLRKEERILADAHALTNGQSDDAEKTGRVLEWVVERMIEMETLLRASIEHSSRCQLIENCLATHAQKRWVVRVFGMTYALPVTVAILVLGILAGLALKKAGIV
jgi:hypothetical protein